ncbi:hypothetical protein IU427_31590 [Nocardia beijingensis]|uniref:hypothetical protein n=1 Tax=Nocardia beijingensis TaxID=95162 RepID=UPI0018953E40|nr:hypothetical protein [Nocardia beijingensis]MBF6469676.1 hypothetical protein [Nocardia beijingensis]
MRTCPHGCCRPRVDEYLAIRINTDDAFWTLVRAAVIVDAVPADDARIRLFQRTTSQPPSRRCFSAQRRPKCTTW